MEAAGGYRAIRRLLYMEVMSMTEDMEATVFRLERELPTGQVIHDEIGVSWEIIAAEVYFCSRNEVKKYANLLPREFYTAKQEKAIKMTLNIWDKAILAYQKTLPHQEQRRIDIEKKWKRERPKYETALNFSLRFGRLTDDELAYIREQTKENDYTPAYDGEYDILDVEYDEIAFNNKLKLLEQMKPVVGRLPVEASKILTAFYDGYTAFAYIPLMACISIMTESAKQQLKEAVDSIKADTKEQFQRAIYHSKALVDCAGICQNDSEKLRGGQKTVWNSFEKKNKKCIVPPCFADGGFGVGVPCLGMEQI